MVKTTLERLDLRISGTVASGSESNSYNEKSNNNRHIQGPILYSTNSSFMWVFSSFIF